jgi:prepilin-type N-terminal cleavage/methylation domain-containing protein
MDQPVTRGEKGFTLLEVVVALSLGAMVILGMVAMFRPMMGTQLDLYRGIRAQSDALLALKALGTDLTQASQISNPAKAGGVSQGDSLAGCINYDADAAGPIDPAQPVVGFRYCLSDGGLYRGVAPRCPTVASDCTAAASLPLAANVSHAAGYNGLFVRPAGAANVVEVHYRVAYGDQSHDVGTSFFLQGAP